jgi:hypothetical protein
MRKPERKDYLEGLDMGGKVIMKRIRRNKMGGHGVN